MLPVLRRLKIRLAPAKAGTGTSGRKPPLPPLSFRQRLLPLGMASMEIELVMDPDHYEAKRALDDIIQAIGGHETDSPEAEETPPPANEEHEIVRPVSPKSQASSENDADPAESPKEVVHRTDEEHDFGPDLSKFFTRKKELELKAERRARLTCKRWQQDRRSLEEIIDSSLKEYIELYETAHAIRIQFEEEKAKWTASLLATISEKMPPASNMPMQFQYEVHQSVPSDDEEPRSRRSKRNTEEISLDVPIPLGARKKFVAPARVPM